MMRYLWQVLIASTAFLLLTIRSSIAAENWVINQFHSDIQIKTDGVVLIAETINVDFGSLSKHGIFRDIPFQYTLNNGQRHYATIQIEEVTINNNPTPYDVSKTGDYTRLKIGDLNKTISGKQTYKIVYNATGVLRPFENHDELYWDVTGEGWPVPIKKASATITLPKSGITQATCYQGPFGSTTPCKSQLSNRLEASFQTTRPLLTNEGLTIVVGYTKGLVPIFTVTPQPQSKSTVNSESLLAPLIAFVITLTLGIGFIGFKWWTTGRDLWWSIPYVFNKQQRVQIKPVDAHRPVVVEYSPPEKLRPAELGTLIDERADTLDVSATIIDLAVRGYLSITEIPIKWIFGETDYLLKKADKDFSELLIYEEKLLKRLFSNRKEIKVSELKKDFYVDLAIIKRQLYKEVVAKRFFPSDPEKIRISYIRIGILLIFAGVVSLAASGAFLAFGGFGLGILLVGILVLVFSRFMPRRTALGYEMYLRTKGYELFISKVEKYRQQFFEKKNMFNEVLPYAIVFGLTEKFAQALKDLGVKPDTTGWYYSSRSLDTVNFTSRINAFSNSLSSAIAATPSRGGFASGRSGFSGGSSGGGFGGGGGGSW